MDKVKENSYKKEINSILVTGNSIFSAKRAEFRVVNTGFSKFSHVFPVLPKLLSRPVGSGPPGAHLNET